MGPRKSRSQSPCAWRSFLRGRDRLEDPFALTREDPDSLGEQRFVTLDLSNSGDLLVVVYTYRESDVIR